MSINRKIRKLIIDMKVGSQFTVGSVFKDFFGNIDIDFVKMEIVKIVIYELVDDGYIKLTYFVGSSMEKVESELISNFVTVDNKSILYKGSELRREDIYPIFQRVATDDEYKSALGESTSNDDMLALTTAIDSIKEIIINSCRTKGKYNKC